MLLFVGVPHLLECRCGPACCFDSVHRHCSVLCPQDDPALARQHSHALALLWRARGWISSGAERAEAVVMTEPSRWTPRQILLVVCAALLGIACLVTCAGCCMMRLRRAIVQWRAQRDPYSPFSPARGFVAHREKAPQRGLLDAFLS